MLANTYVIGDVHGCYHTLQNLLSLLPKNARVIFVGDLCDRGLYTKEVFELVIKKGYEVIRGNHEDYMYTHAFDALEKKANRWIDEDYMGGKESIKSYENDKESFLKHRDFIATLPRYIMVENFFITHGFGLPYYQRRDKSSAHIGLLKNRISDEKDWGYDWEDNWETYPVINIFGHTVYDEPLVEQNYIGIDTGCGEGKKLTAINLETKEFISVLSDKRDFF